MAFQKAQEDGQEVESGDWTQYAPYFRFAGKRSVPGDDAECEIYRYTLGELYSIVEEEADIFEQCLNTEGKKIYFLLFSTMKRAAGSSCDVHRYTLTELFEIVKEEAELYENCLANAGKN